MKKVSRLTTTFFRNFLLLIVIPILLVTLIALGIIRNMMLESAFETCDLAQHTVATTISNEIRENSLKLSHFLLTNDSQALTLAEEIAMTEGQGRYQHSNRLGELYNFVVTPSSDIIAIHFYTRDGETIALKDGLALPIDEVRRYDFYHKAQAYPQHTSFGLINSAFTFKTVLTEPSRQALAISFAPHADMEDGSIEMVCWYTYTSINRVITDYSREATQGEMYLVDSAGNILLSPLTGDLKYSIPKNIETYEPGRHPYTDNGSKRYVIISKVPGTDWRLVSLVDHGLLVADFNRVSTAVMLTSMVVFALFILFSVIFLRNIIRPMNALMVGMSKVEGGDLHTRLTPTGQKEMRTLMDSFNSMIEQTQELLIQNEVQQKEKMSAEIKALQSQINPHFLVNSLNSIRFTAMMSRFDNIRNMAEALIKILTASFKDPGSQYTIRDEVEMLESYIYLMKIRYSENFDVIWDIQDACLDYGIPRLLIQPMVENAITHGFEDREEPGTIHITIEMEDEDIRIAIADNGRGMTQARATTLLDGNSVANQDGHGIGVANVNRRIQLNYGNGYGVSVNSEEGIGSTFVLVIPARRVEDSDHA